ncbi:MAG: hypothetical protein JXB88_10535 [Spirochaetales bacterium]|nr:hypothetical protein [Spirochaetales bacterium]
MNFFKMHPYKMQIPSPLSANYYPDGIGYLKSGYLILIETGHFFIYINYKELYLFLLKLHFYPNWEDIVVIRNFIISILSQKITSHEEAYRVALVASELMENACRYSTEEGINIELEQDMDNTHIELRIKNITHKENIKKFKKIFELINNGSAREAYKKMMIRVINSKDDAISQLGLARIRYEGHSEISYKIESDIKPLLKGRKNVYNDKQLVLCIKSKISITPKGIGETDGI